MPSASIDFTRAFIEENVPDSMDLQERKMFGMIMWLVRGNMFLGVGLSTDRLLVRVGEEQIESLLAKHTAGVERCGAASGRIFPGTLVVSAEQFRGNAKLKIWFDLAMEHNQTMAAKESSDKPRKKATGKRKNREPAEKDGSQDDEEVLPSVETPPPAPRPPTTSGGAFARCVLDVINRIPSGKVAAYGQIAALAGAPKNARQVGSMLKDGLCAGGAPWHRVLGASGKISLPAGCGGDTQRGLLEAEGVQFTDAGAVSPGTFWDRAQPFFTAAER